MLQQPSVQVSRAVPTRSFRRRACAMSLCLVLLSSSFLTGCAVLDTKQRRLTHYTIEQFQFESIPLRMLTFPALFVAGSATLLVDGLVVNPVFNAPDALGDSMWAFFMFPMPTGFPEIVLLPVRVVAFPTIFLGSEIVRCMIPMPWRVI